MMCTCGHECMVVSKGITVSRGTDANTPMAVAMGQKSNRVEMSVGGQCWQCPSCGAEYAHTPPSLISASKAIREIAPKQQTAGMKTRRFENRATVVKKNTDK